MQIHNKQRTYAQALLAALGKVKGKKEGEGAHERVGNFLLLLKQKGDMKRLPGILREFSELRKKQKGEIARIISANPLSSSVKVLAQRTLKKKGYIAKEEVQPSALGGAAVFLGKEYMFDDTLRDKLRRMFAA